MASQGQFFDNWDYNINKTTEGRYSSKSHHLRLASITSLIATGALSSNFPAKRRKQESHELFGFRKLAKSYLWGSGNEKTRPSSRKEEATLGPSSRLRNVGSKRLSGGEIASSRGKKLLPQKRGYSSTCTAVTTNRENPYAERTMKLPLNNEKYYQELFEPSYKSHDNLAAELVNEIGPNEGYPLQSDEEPEKIELEQRVVSFYNLPKSTGLNSLLAQVHGGPLEKIESLKDQDDHSVLRCVQLHFTSALNASNFMTFVHSRKFNVNGYTLEPAWAPQYVNHISAIDHEKTRGKHDRKKYHDFHIEPRRCLILKKYSTSRNSRSTRHSHTCAPVLAAFDVKELREDFEQFGEIMEITPMVSRKLCFSLSFFDIKDAISAFESYENCNEFLYKKYHKHWSLGYGADVTDRPCILAN